MKIKIERDVYQISKRLKFIDKDYYVVYDTSRSCFEIHNSAQVDSSYCLTLPYDYLDERTLNYVWKTRSTNLEEILDKIEYDNKLLENSNKTEVFKQLNDAVEF